MICLSNLYLHVIFIHLIAYNIGCHASTIVFATSADLTTSSGPTVVAYHNGVRAAFAEYNAATGGGYRGVPLQFIALDDQYNATRAVENTRLLLRDYNVTALFASSGTDSVISSLPLARAAGVPIMFPATGAQAIRTPFDPYVINNMASYDDQVRVMIKYSVGTLMHSRISVVYVNDGFGRPPALAGIAFLKQIGFDPHSVASYERNTYDVTAALNSLFSKPKLPQTVVFVGLCIEAGLLIRGFQQRTQYATTFILISVCSLPSLANTLGPGADYSNILAIRTTPDPNVASPLSERFHDVMLRYGPAGAVRDHMALQGYLNGLVVAQILSRHDSRLPVTPSSFMSVVYNTNVFSTYDVASVHISMYLQLDRDVTKECGKFGWSRRPQPAGNPSATKALQQPSLHGPLHVSCLLVPSSRPLFGLTRAWHSTPALRHLMLQDTPSLWLESRRAYCSQIHSAAGYRAGVSSCSMLKHPRQRLHHGIRHSMQRRALGQSTKLRSWIDSWTSTQ
ncbi:periplasmic binding protein-like I [Catenaria anguillulae PL171]|uniref:Periplasmic binding protein-like I n=1 Tax=Catenaria anguillulae PL171 TaxID=765915 RepID=A0A1Y2HW21_9FUNG|nr:periplasmic binding protein-like I [Catenaria anguillulae PL171]